MMIESYEKCERCSNEANDVAKERLLPNKAAIKLRTSATAARPLHAIISETRLLLFQHQIQSKSALFETQVIQDLSQSDDSFALYERNAIKLNSNLFSTVYDLTSFL